MNTSWDQVEALCRLDNPLDWTSEREHLYEQAMAQAALYHQQACSDLAAWYQFHGFDARQLDSNPALALKRLPPLNVQAMKYFLFLSLPESEAVLRLTSSGTHGQKTQIWFDQPSLDRVQAMLASLWRQQGLVTETPTNYLMFIYDPNQSGDLGIAYSLANQQRFAPKNREFFAIRKDHAGAWKFDLEGVLDTLKVYQEDGCPVRLLGIPAFVHELLAHLESAGQRFHLPKESFVLTGGGWKAAEDKRVSKEVFRVKIADYLGITEDNILDGYGMAEHSAPYMECRHHRFHVPAYCRIQIRSPETMACLEPGEVGLIELQTPFNAMMPNLSVLSTDLGMLDPLSCPCGYTSPTFSLMGRAGKIKHKGCAINAAEVVKGTS